MTPDYRKGDIVQLISDTYAVGLMALGQVRKRPDKSHRVEVRFVGDVLLTVEAADLQLVAR